MPQEPGDLDTDGAGLAIGGGGSIRCPLRVRGHDAGDRSRTAPPLDRQAELAHEAVGELGGVQAREAHRAVGPPHHHARTRRQVVRAAPVAPQDAGAVGALEHLDRHRVLRPDDERFGEQRVR